LESKELHDFAEKKQWTVISVETLVSSKKTNSTSKPAANSATTRKTGVLREGKKQQQQHDEEKHHRNDDDRKQHSRRSNNNNNNNGSGQRHNDQEASGGSGGKHRRSEEDRNRRNNVRNSGGKGGARGGKGGWRGAGKSRHISGEDFYTFSLDGLLPSYGDPSQVSRLVLVPQVKLRISPHLKSLDSVVGTFKKFDIFFKNETFPEFEFKPVLCLFSKNEWFQQEMDSCVLKVMRKKIC
jgi:hypothetical protein